LEDQIFAKILIQMKKYALILTILVLGTTFHVQAQNTSSSYRTAVGVKFYPGAISVKHFLNDNAVEGLASFWRGGVRFTGLYELHFPLLQVEGLQWYVGPGAHLGFYDDKRYDGSVFFGIDGVLGVDYKIPGAPLNVSLDWNPSFEFGDGADFQSWGGLGVRFTF
jgi:hypothetical protein